LRHRAALPAIVLLLLFAAGCGKDEQQQPSAPVQGIRYVEAVRKDMPVYREWVGQTLGAEDVEIRARVEGWLESIHFTEGTEVRKGSLLYTIDPRELEQQVNAQRAQLAQAKTMLARADADVRRYRPLAQAGAVSQRQLDIALAEQGARQGEVDAVQAALKLAEINLGYATVRSPVTGVIGLTQARVGDFVGRVPNPIILNTVSRIDSMRVQFSITEQEYLDFVRRAGGQSPQLRKRWALDLVLADGSVYPDKGMIRFAERRIDASTGTLLLEAIFPNTERMLRPGQYGKVRAVFETAAGATVIPARAVVELQGLYQGYVLEEGNTVSLRRLTMGPRAGQEWVVKEGIQPGEKVIVDGIQRIRPGMTVDATAAPADTAVGAQQGGGR
jgi:membrane fusion protein (multidrug efflux system)